MSGSLIDSFGRKINYLRLSITDRCNLRCLYCMPHKGVDLMTHNEILRFEEILKICGVLAGLGISAIRVTGGEPLVRRGAADFIAELKKVNDIKHVTMTSNGVLLREHLKALAAAGLDAVNISLDTLDREKFHRLTGGEGFDNILPAIDKALELGLVVKINCVPLRDFNESDIAKLATLAKNKNIAVRFIELMPLGAAAGVQFLPSDKVVSLIEEAHGPMKSITLNSGNGPAIYYKLPDFNGSIGIISAVSGNFCKGCNRLRLTASGVLKPCLFGTVSADLRSLVRSGAADEEIAEAVQKLVLQKPAGQNIGDNNEINMFRIGG